MEQGRKSKKTFGEGAGGSDRKKDAVKDEKKKRNET